jgi:hypothetical protein
MIKGDKYHIGWFKDDEPHGYGVGNMFNDKINCTKEHEGWYKKTYLGHEKRKEDGWFQAKFISTDSETDRNLNEKTLTGDFTLIKIE